MVPCSLDLNSTGFDCTGQHRHTHFSTWKNEPTCTSIMPTKTFLLALFALTTSVIASPRGTGDFENDCIYKNFDDDCMILDSQGVGIDGICKNVLVSDSPGINSTRRCYD